MKFTISFSFLLLILISCNQNNTIVLQPKEDQSVLINSSYSNTDEVRTTQLELDLQVNFSNNTIKGKARHIIENLTGADKFILDTKNLDILKVTKGDTNELEIDYQIGAADSIFGSPLIINISKGDKIINVYYKTTAESEALGWIDGSQTTTGSPFLYTQGEAILTRTWIPIQDMPSNKITYNAKVTVPDTLMALMSATNPQSKSDDGVYHFVMDKPISSYLIALAVGDISFKAIDERTGVYAETPLIDKVHEEMSEMPQMLKAAESLCGKYEWDRYDVLVLPNSFPFGGMENPKLTFLTPTIIVGDKSLTSVTAHELAHSWSGNLVTNRSWNDFWLNEGWTVYIEHRIMESLKGKEFSDALSIIEWHEFLTDKQYAESINKNYLNSLYVSLDGMNPDDGMTSVPYGKGAFFFKTLEKKIGRKKMDLLIQTYFNELKFKTIDTDVFLQFLRKEIKNIDQLMKLDEWIYKTNIPTSIYHASTKRMNEMEELASYIAETPMIHQSFTFKKKKYVLKRESFTTQEWMHLLRSLPRDTPRKTMAYLDKYIDFNSWNNAEIQTEWFLLAIDANYKQAFPAMEKFLGIVGRRKFLQPIYVKLAETDSNKEYAKEIFAKSKGAYHSVSIATIEEILNE